MTAPLPENIRHAGYDALEELADRMFRGARSLSKHAMRLRLDEPKSHREALCQLRRYQNFEMPCFEEVAKIEGALMGLTEPESRALTERRRLEKHKKEQARGKVRAEWLEKQWEQGGWQRQMAMRQALERAAMLFKAVNYAEKNVGGDELVKALACCLDAKMANQDPFCDLAIKLNRIDGHREEVAGSAENVIAGPWNNGGEARP